MSKVDLNWFKTDIGTSILQSVKYNGKIKNFGLLEKPALSAPYSQYEEASFKILSIGKSFCGKTTLVESLCCSKSSASNYNPSDFENYIETPGIQITHLYWPVKMVNSDKFMMFDIALWDVGKLASIKYDYIQPSCFENLDCILFVFSWTDKESFLEIYDIIKKYYSSPNEQNLAKIIIGTKFDQIIHSDIEKEMIDEIENFTKSKIISFSSVNNCSFDQISKIMNKLVETLWDRKYKSQ